MMLGRTRQEKEIKRDCLEFKKKAHLVSGIIQKKEMQHRSENFKIRQSPKSISPDPFSPIYAPTLYLSKLYKISSFSSCFFDVP